MSTTSLLELYNTHISPHVHLPPRIHILTHDLLALLPPSLNLTLSPLLALADFALISVRTIQTGTTSLLDVLLICPGLHHQSKASSLNNNEYPSTAAMTTGYVFRTENQAMVHFMQRVGITGSLVTLDVKPGKGKWLGGLGEWIFGPAGVDAPHLVAAMLTLDVLAGCVLIGDEWALACVSMLILSRILNAVAIRRRLAPEWHGMPEPGVQSDLLVLLSQDRWVRIQGPTDDVKAVTSGQWLRDQRFVEQCLVDAGTVLVYGAVVVGSNASQKGALIIAALLLGSSVLLGISNWKSGERFWIHGRMVEVRGVKAYERRRFVADELIESSGRRDWAVQMGMIPGKEGGGGQAIM